MRKVASIVLNNFTRDNRVLKENLSLQKAGYRILVVALHESGLPEKENINGIEVVRVKLKTRTWSKSVIISAIKYLEFVYRAMKLTKGCDIVHCNDLETLPAGCFRKFLKRKTKLVYDAHEFETQKTSNAHPTRIWLNRLMEKWFIGLADEVLTVSKSIADEYEKMYQIKKPHLIYNCPPKSMKTDESFDLFRQELNIPVNQKIYLYQGGFSHGRGIDMIIEVFRQLKDKTVIFMGYGPYLQKVIDATENYDNMYYKEAVPFEQIIKYTKSADWGLLTIQNVSKSYYYSLPNKLFEYVIAGIPYVALPMLEIRNITLEYYSGIIAENESKQALKDAVIKADNTNPAIFKKALARMSEKFNWEEQEVKLIEIYNNL